MANFNGQTAVITGGAQGIGLATAKRFINDGCKVMIWDIDKKLGMDAAKELNCHFLEVDQTDNKVVEQATAETINQLKKIDFIVDPKQLTNKLKNNNFKGEIGNSITLDILGHKIDYLIIIGLGDKNKFNSDVLRNTMADCIRKVTDKEEKIGLLLPWDGLKRQYI